MARRQAQDVKRTEPVSSGAKSVTRAPSQQQAIGTPRPKAANGKVMPAQLRARIETLAYELYERRGRQDGYDKEDWLEAERITLSQPASVSQHGVDHLSVETLV